MKKEYQINQFNKYAVIFAAFFFLLCCGLYFIGSFNNIFGTYFLTLSIDQSHYANYTGIIFSGLISVCTVYIVFMIFTGDHRVIITNSYIEYPKLGKLKRYYYKDLESIKFNSVMFRASHAFAKKERLNSLTIKKHSTRFSFFGINEKSFKNKAEFTEIALLLLEHANQETNLINFEVFKALSAHLENR